MKQGIGGRHGRSRLGFPSPSIKHARGSVLFLDYQILQVRLPHTTLGSSQSNVNN